MRPIDADKLKEQMFSRYDCVNEHTGKSTYTGKTLMDYEVADLIEDCIEAAPTLTYDDLVPHGRWEIGERTFCVKGRDGFIRDETKLTYTCDKCNVGVVGLEGMRYCPNCGAKMDGGETDEA